MRRVLKASFSRESSSSDGKEEPIPQNDGNSPVKSGNQTEIINWEKMGGLRSSRQRQISFTGIEDLNLNGDQEDSRDSVKELMGSILDIYGDEGNFRRESQIPTGPKAQPTFMMKKANGPANEVGNINSYFSDTEPILKHTKSMKEPRNSFRDENESKRIHESILHFPGPTEEEPKDHLYKVDEVDYDLTNQNKLEAHQNPQESKESSQFVIDIKMVTSLMKTRFQAVEQDSVFDRPLNLEAKDGLNLTSPKDLIDKFGDDEIVTIQKLLNSKDKLNRKVGMTRRSKTFVSSIQDKKEVAYVKKKTQLSSLEGELLEDEGESKKSYLEDLKEVALIDIESISSLNDVFKLYANQISCFTVSSSLQNYAILGLQSGKIIEVMPGKKPETLKKVMKTPISAIGVSHNLEYFAVGSTDGELYVSKTDGKMADKSAKIPQQSIQDIKFISETHFLVLTLNSVLVFTLKSYMLKLSLSDFTIFNQNEHISCMGVLVHSKFNLVGLSVGYKIHTLKMEFNSVKEAFVVSRLNGMMSPQDFRPVEDPNSSPDSFQTKSNSASTSTGSSNDKSEQSISKSHHKSETSLSWPLSLHWIEPQKGQSSIYMVTFCRDEICLAKTDSKSINIESKSIIESRIVWGCILNDRIITYLNPSLEIEFISLDKIFNNTMTSENVYTKKPLVEGFIRNTKEKEMLEQIGSQLDDKDLKGDLRIWFQRVFAARICSPCSRRIFFSTIEGITTIGLSSFDSQVKTYVSKGQHISAIKLLNTIFLGRVSVCEIEKESIKQTVPFIIKSYLEKILIGRITQEDLIQILDIVLECLVYSDNVSFAFSELKNKFGNYLFWKEVSKLIKQRRITRIPDSTLVESVDFLEDEDVIILLQEFPLEFGKQDDDTFSNILTVVKRKNLWPFLYKLCILNPNQTVPLFLTMLQSEILVMKDSIKSEILMNTFFRDLKKIKASEYFQLEEQKVIFRIFWFLHLILSPGGLSGSMKHFIDNPNLLKDNLPVVFFCCVDWLLSKQNFEFLLKTCAPMTFELLYWMFSNTQYLNYRPLFDLISKSQPTTVSKLNSKDEIHQVSLYRAVHELKNSRTPFNLTMTMVGLIESLAGEFFSQETGFLAMRILNFIVYPEVNKYEIIEWVAHYVKCSVKGGFLEGKFWFDFRAASQDTFEDLIVSVVDKMEGSRAVVGMKKEISEIALNNR